VNLSLRRDFLWRRALIFAAEICPPFFGLIWACSSTLSLRLTIQHYDNAEGTVEVGMVC